MSKSLASTKEHVGNKPENVKLGDVVDTKETTRVTWADIARRGIEEKEEKSKRKIT